MMLLPLIAVCILQSGSALAMSMEYRRPYPHIYRDDVNFDSTCSSDPWWVKPIAISLGMDAITAAYAYSYTNVSVIAYLATEDPDANLTAYAEAMYELRQRYERTWDAPREEPPAPVTGLQGWLRDIWWEYGLLFEDIWDRVSGSWASLRQAVETSTSQLLAPSRVAMGYLAPAIELATSPLKAGATKIGLFPSAEGLTEYALRDTLTVAVAVALEMVKARALQDSGIDITAAIVLYPDFLNPLACKTWWLHPQYNLERACRRAGIETMTYQPMSDRLLIESSLTTLWETEAAQGLHSRNPMANVIILDQGLSNFDVMVLSPYCSMSLPVEELKCTSVVYASIFGNPNKSLLLEELERGASFNRLASEILRTRALLEAEHEGSRDRDEDAAEEWPVHLDGWWVGDFAQPIFLRWEDVKRGDDLYEDTLLDALREAQSCVIQGANKCGEPSNSTIDGVVILNSYCDASLMTSAITEAVGDQVKIFGATSGTDLTYVARLGARYALKRRDRAVQHMKDPCQQADSGEEPGLWYLIHEEL
ncbi:hypothetical protein BJX68DRAFT_136159 [Aspergillus pseudodeflectus]|uniref:Uncharacterized protein n=1 Tax=Aspergillus pseudodeflectus TaxID=176178 RepID=A0ABR4JYI8_9EURO